MAVLIVIIITITILKLVIKPLHLCAAGKLVLAMSYYSVVNVVTGQAFDNRVIFMLNLCKNLSRSDSRIVEGDNSVFSRFNGYLPES